MSDKETEKKAVEQLLVEEFVKYRLPEIMKIKQSVDAGNPLTGAELYRMEYIIEKADSFREFIHYYPEYEEIVGKIISTYHEITTIALENESKS